MTLREVDGIDPVAILTSRGWLSRRPPSFRDAVLAQAVEQRRAAGEPLFHSGDEAGGLFGVIRGVIEIATRYSGNDVHIVHLGQAGSWFGIAPTIIGAARRLGIVARTDLRAAYVAPAAINAIAAAQPDNWRHLAALTIENSDLAVGAAADLMIRDVERRCLAVLLRVSDCRYADPAAGDIAVAPLSQEELAAMANLSRNAVGTVLRAHAAAGSITLGYRSMQIHAPARLRAIVEAG